MNNYPFFKDKMINNILCGFPYKIPINNSHYITGKNMMLFSKLMSIENDLTSLTCYGNNLYNCLKNNFKR